MQVPRLSTANPVPMSNQTHVAPNLSGGRWHTPDAGTFTNVHNPSTGEVIARAPSPQRAAVMFRYRELLEAHFDELAALITRENGKTWEEARGDVRRGIEVVELACAIGHLLKGENLPQIADQIDAQTSREPLGVCVGITPFNFPAMV